MKRLYTKILLWILPFMTLIALSGCGSSGTPSDTELVGNEVNPFSINIKTPDYIFSKEKINLIAEVHSEKPYIIQWKQLEGQIVMIENNTSTNAFFTAPDISAASLLMFEVTATTEDNESISSNVYIDLYASQLQVYAGRDISATANHLVALHGNANLGDHTISAQIEWIQVQGKKVTLIDGDTFNPTFTTENVNATTDLVFSLHVSTDFFTQEDNVTVSVSPSMTHTLNISPILAHSGSQVVVHSNSIPTTSATHQWTQLSGPTVILITPTAPTTSFAGPTVPSTNTPPIVLSHTTPHPVTGQPVPTIHTIYVVPPVPTLDIIVSPVLSMDEGKPSSLHVSASGGDGSYTYTWTQTSGPTVTLDETHPSAPTFTAPSVPKDDHITFNLSVNDGQGETRTATLGFDIINLIIAVNAGADIHLSGGHTAYLQGSITNTTLPPYSYSWIQVNGITLPIINDHTLNPTIDFPISISGNYEFELKVTDALGNVATDSIVISSLLILTLDAGANQTVNEDSNVSLFGSTFGQSGQLQVQWTQELGTNVILKDADTLNPTFISPLLTINKSEKLTFKLLISDDLNRTVQDTVNITVNPNFPKLSLNTPTDYIEYMSSSMQVNVNGGDAPFTYTWFQSGDFALNITSVITAKDINFTAPAYVAGSDKMTCTVTDAKGRGTSVSASFGIGAIPPSQLLTLNASSSSKIQEGKIGVLQVNVQGGTPPYTYSWEVLSGKATILNTIIQNPSFIAGDIDTTSEPVTFKVTVKDNGSPATSVKVTSIVLNTPLIASTQGDLNALFGQTIHLHGKATGGVSPYSYAWTDSILSGSNPTLDTQSLKLGVTDFVFYVEDLVKEKAQSHFNVTVSKAPRTLNSISKQILEAKSTTTNKFTLTPTFTGESFHFTVKETSGKTPTFQATLSPTTGTESTLTLTAPDATASVVGYSFEITATDANDANSSYTSSFYAEVHVPPAIPARTPITGIPVCSGRGCDLPAVLISKQDCGFATPYAMQSITDDPSGFFNVEITCVNASTCNRKWWEETSDRSECTDDLGQGGLGSALRTRNYTYTCDYCSDKQGGIVDPHIYPDGDKMFIGTH